MALDSYANLQTSILDWIARPGDPLVAPAVPDMIAMFEEEARDRLRTRFNESASTQITIPANSNIVALPSDFIGLRGLYLTTAGPNRRLTFQTPDNLDTNFWYSPGSTWAFTIEGLNLRAVGYTEGDPLPINIDYTQGLPGLSNTITSNWLLQSYPSLYLWGALTFASLYIGDDGRAPQWLSAREAGFNRIQLADRKARFSGGPLIIQTDTRNP
jgi:hypothetical protein